MRLADATSSAKRRRGAPGTGDFGTKVPLCTFADDTLLHSTFGAYAWQLSIDLGSLTLSLSLSLSLSLFLSLSYCHLTLQCCPKRIQKPEDSLWDYPWLLKDLSGRVELTLSWRIRFGCQARGMPLQHAMFYGPPGTGKTMVAQRFAEYSGRGAWTRCVLDWVRSFVFAVLNFKF